MATYVPIMLDLIDQGELLEAINVDLDQTHRGIAEYVEKHGDLAEGAKAELTVKVTFQVVNPKDGFISIKGTTKVALPSRPPSLSIAMTQEDEGGLGLFVKKSGSEAASPRQGALCTQAGQAVDPETGEVVADEAAH